MSHSLLALILIWGLFLPAGHARAGGVWGTRPLLSYFALTSSLEAPLRGGARLTDYHWGVVQGAAEWEFDSLRRLELSSNLIVVDPQLSLADKRRRIAELGYNRRVDQIVYQTDLRLRASLPADAYARLVAWIERRWRVEQRLHGLGSTYARGSAAAARTYQIFATHYDSKGAYIVALPDKCLKFSNGGSKICQDQGYQPGAGYSVAISYQSGTGALVGESGPWNIDDNYWAALTDPQPRRMFADLPLGMPEAQAAYFDGYNGGQDQYGRKVTGPYGIDLGRQVGDDIGLKWGKNDWITISFLWTADWGGRTAQQPGGTTAPGAQPQPTSNLIQPIELAAPAADGSITHEVQPGQSLWAIAIAYKVRIAQLQLLNNLGQTVVIYSGQKLLIKEAGSTWTPEPVTPGAASPSAAASETPTLSQPARQTQRSLRRTQSAETAAAQTETASAAPPTPSPPEASVTASSSRPARTPIGGDAGGSLALDERSMLAGGLILAALGAALFGLGWLFGARNKKEEDES